MVRLPYAPRPGQEEMADAILAVQAEGGHLLIEAPTGIGKTVAALAASLTTCRQDGRKLIIATRTNSQQDQVLRERNALGGDELMVPFMGRRQTCPFLRDKHPDGSPEELSRLCRDAKQKAREEAAGGRPVTGACPHFRRLLQDGDGPAEAILRAGVSDAAAFAHAVEKAGSCPYEAAKALLPRADAVVLPAVFLLDGRLRRAMLEWLGTGADGCHLLVDEAHHVPASAREHHSPVLTVATLQRAMKEAEDVHDPTLMGRVLTTSVLDALLRVVYRLADEFVTAEDDDADGLLPPGTLEEALLAELRVPSPALGRIAAELEQWGEAIREERRAKGRLPRSYLGTVGSFLSFWLTERDAPYVHLITGGSKPAVEAFLLDPAMVLGWLQEFWSTVQMSGTLAPLEDHRDLCGLPPASRRLVLSDPFAADHLQVWGLEGVHRRVAVLHADPGATARQQEAARALIRAWQGRMGLFFPSHRMLREYVEEGFLHGIDATVHMEEPGMPQGALTALVAAFRRDPAPRALLLGVLGGRLTEGIDYPGDAMEHMLLFGVPYPRPTARSQALIHYYDAKAGTGWQTAVHHPTGRTMRQAVGRLIRGPDDTGTAVVLDERVRRFATMLPRLRMAPDVATVLRGPARTADGFGTADALLGPS